MSLQRQCVRCIANRVNVACHEKPGTTYLKSRKMRILGLDYGSKRIGVALCDELGLTGQGLTTIVCKNRNQVLDALADLVRNHDVEKIVIGYPLRLDGTEGIQCEKVNRFVRSLEARLSIPVIKWDETLSSRTAEDILIQSGVRRDRRKKIVDKMAAGIILQDYLNSLHPSDH
jgi:putative Holliday junction resolvase